MEPQHRKHRGILETTERPLPAPRSKVSLEHLQRLTTRLYVRDSVQGTTRNPAVQQMDCPTALSLFHRSPPPTHPRHQPPHNGAALLPPLAPPLPVRRVVTSNSSPPAAPRSVLDGGDQRVSRVRPFLRNQRSSSPNDSFSSITPETSPQEFHQIVRERRAQLPRQHDVPTDSPIPPRMLDGVDPDESVTDSSLCEDLPVPKLREASQPSSRQLPLQRRLSWQPKDSGPPSHRYRKHSEYHAPSWNSTQSPAQPNPLTAHGKISRTQQQQHYYHHRQPQPPQPLRSPSFRDSSSIDDGSFAPAIHGARHQSTQSRHPANHHPIQAMYPQAPDYAELWNNTAMHLQATLEPHLKARLPSTAAALANELKTGVHLANFLNSLVGQPVIKKVYDAHGERWQYRARQNLFHCREVFQQVGVPKHRLFSVSRVLAADSTVGLFGLLHCLQTCMEILSSKTTNYITGGLGVKEKLSGNTTAYRSLIGEVTTSRSSRHKTLSPPKHYVQTNSHNHVQYYPGNGAGVYSDV